MSLFCQNKLSLIIYWGTILEPLWIRKAVEKIDLKTQFSCASVAPNGISLCIAGI